MDVNKEREILDLIDNTSENKAILSEDALRQLSKSLTKLIPKTVESRGDSVFAYGFPAQAASPLMDYKGTPTRC